MPRWLSFAAVLLCGTVIGPAPSRGGTPFDRWGERPWDPNTVSVSASVGVLHGTANEYVYNPDGSKLSQLIWKFDNDVVVNGEVVWSPWRWLYFGVRGRFSVDDPSTLDDYDFNLMGCPPSGGGTLCHSHHDDTRLQNASTIDLFLAATFVRAHGFALSALVGYRWDYFRWLAYGGWANYAVLPQGLGITYEQWWEAPYIGLEFKGEWSRWIVGGRVTGSWWADSYDHDNHHWRGLLFVDEIATSSMINAYAEIGYRLTRDFSLFVSYEYQMWQLAKGSTELRDYVNGGSAGFPGDAAGADNTSHTFSVGGRLTLGAYGR